MSTQFLPRLLRTALLTLLALVACISPAFAQFQNREKILGGYFEEWSIYYAGYNIANLQQNGVADKLTHLLYAFGDVTTTPAPACAYADTWADYQSPYLPSVNGTPYPGPLYGNFAAIQQLKALHPKLKVLMSLGGASAANTAAFVTAASNAAGRQALAASCIDMFVSGNIAPGITAPGLFDGFNIDWEFPTATDKQNFTALLTEFRSQLNALSRTTGKQYTLSTSISSKLPRRWISLPSTVTTIPAHGSRRPMTRRRYSIPGRIHCLARNSTSMTL
jgi:chitinase